MSGAISKVVGQSLLWALAAAVCAPAAQASSPLHVRAQAAPPAVMRHGARPAPSPASGASTHLACLVAAHELTLLELGVGAPLPAPLHVGGAIDRGPARSEQ